MLFDGRIIAGTISILIAIGLTGVVVWWNRILQWRPALGPKMDVLVGDFRTWTAALMVVFLAIIFSPFIEDQRWPFASWFTSSLAPVSGTVPPPQQSVPEQASAPSFAQTYRLSDHQIRELADALFAAKDLLSAGVPIESLIMDGRSSGLAGQLRTAFDMSGITVSGFGGGHLSSPKDVGVLIRVRDLQAIPDGAKAVAEAIGRVTGVKPTIIYAPENLPNPNSWALLVGPPLQ